MILDWNEVQKVHFTGIGGIGMSALAEILLARSIKISGSDIQPSTIINKLASHGAQIFIGHKGSNVDDDCDLLVYTAAVKQDNPELTRAATLKIPIMERSEFLGHLMQEYNYGIAISGTHGKTTTTSMISLIMDNYNLDPTILIGGKLDAIGGNVKVGKKNQFFITEACEYVETFLKLHPYLGVILNIDADHLDYFKSFENIIASFKKFAKLIPKEGYLIICGNDPNYNKIIDSLECNIVVYGLNGDFPWSAEDIQFDQGGMPHYTLVHNGIPKCKVQLSVPGNHNVSNSLAAIASAYALGIPIESSVETLKGFYGTQRRFEKKGSFNNITVVDDYAHHPTEIAATLSAAQNYPHNRIWCVFQPHLFSRTKSLLHEFSQAFKVADKVVITDIYAAREKDEGEISSKDLVNLMKNTTSDVMYIPSFFDVINYLSKNLEPGDVVITMGAGDVYQVGEALLESKNP